MSPRPPTPPDILDAIMAGPPPVLPPAPAVTTIAITAIVNDGGTQMRAGMNADTVKEYEDALTDAEAWPFPPVIVYHDGAKYWLADGFHRLNAAHRSGKFSEIPADIKAGTRRDAVLYAAGANASHGLRRTNDDKKRAVKALLEDQEWSKWSDREIARRCAVSAMFVGNLRKELSVNGLQMPTERTVERSGQTYQQNTANIGANRSQPPAMLAVWELQATVREVYAQVYGGNPEPYATRDMRTGAQMRAGRFWLLCTQSLPANQFRLSDLAQAINNVASQYEDPKRTAPQVLPGGYTVPEAREDKPLPAWAADDSPALKPIELPSHADSETRVRFQKAGRSSVDDLVQTFGYGFAFHPKPPYGDGMVDLSHHARETHIHRKLGVFATDEEATQAARRDLQERIAAAVPPLESPTAGKPLVDYTEEDWEAARIAEKQRIAAATVAQTVADVVEVHGEPAPVVPEPVEALPVSQRADYESDEWYTPQEYIDAARSVMGAIDLDPASSEMAQTVVRAGVYLTRFDDGLAQTRWIHQRIWLNPPYSNPAPWVEKLVREHQAGPFCTEAIVLVNNATETSWFQLLLERFPVCLPARRLAFWRHDHANVGARQGQAFFYLGPNVAKFQEVFSQFGPILRRLL